MQSNFFSVKLFVQFSSPCLRQLLIFELHFLDALTDFFLTCGVVFHFRSVKQERIGLTRTALSAFFLFRKSIAEVRCCRLKRLRLLLRLQASLCSRLRAPPQFSGSKCFGFSYSLPPIRLWIIV